VTFLLDVNVLIALFDPLHVQHEAAHQWFETTGRQRWATCPITENGVIRILSQSNYPNSPGPPSVTSSLLFKMRNLSGHEFWADDISLLDGDLIDPQRLLTHGQITDSYLLALARFHGGYLATFDRRLSAAAVNGGADALHIIGAHPQ
jgi:toxin-antitoxin system PIN domain toxin